MKLNGIGDRAVQPLWITITIHSHPVVPVYLAPSRSLKVATRAHLPMSQFNEALDPVCPSQQPRDKDRSEAQDARVVNKSAPFGCLRAAH